MGGPLFAIIFAGLIVLILLVIGQLFYKKFRIVSITIWCLAVFLLFYFTYAISTSNSRFGDLALNDYVGTYKIDVDNSSYESFDLKQYSNLQLNVKSNKTFSFSYKTPFFKDSFGYWQPMDDGEFPWVEISVGKGELSEADVDREKWIFSGPDLANGNSRNSIVFTRNK